MNELMEKQQTLVADLEKSLGVLIDKMHREHNHSRELKVEIRYVEKLLRLEKEQLNALKD